MSSLHILESEYPGDAAWQQFVSSYRPAWGHLIEKAALLDALQDEDIAIVLAGYMGKSALRWYGSPCPALDGKTPAEVRKNECSGLQVIRSLLMRMP